MIALKFSALVLCASVLVSLFTPSFDADLVLDPCLFLLTGRPTLKSFSGLVEKAGTAAARAGDSLAKKCPDNGLASGQHGRLALAASAAHCHVAKRFKLLNVTVQAPLRASQT